MSDMTTAAISTTRLSKTYHVGFIRKRKVLALRDLDLEVSEGQVFGLLGPNGAGKSTAIKLVLDLIRPTSGEARVFGHKPSTIEARAQLGFLPENPAPYEYLTGAEFVTLAAQLAGLTAPALSTRVREVIEKVGMTPAADLRIRRYSKGMMQRISLAQALVHEPKLLILDEPTSGLDVLGRQMIRDIIVEQRKRGTTIVFSSHIIPDVEALCDRVAVLIGGRLVKQGSVAELLSAENALTEITFEQLPGEALAPLETVLKGAEVLGERLVVRCDDQHVRDVLTAAIAKGARVVHLQRTRYSLEELFLKAVKESAQPAVGSYIS